MAKGACTFQPLSTAEIIAAFEEWGLSFTPEQLHRPTSDFVEFAYCACLYQVAGIKQEDLRGPAQQVLSSTSLVDKELHASSFSGHLLLYHLARLAKASALPDFSSKDIQAPERERTLMILSAFINFIRFTRQLCFDFVTSLREKADKVVTERDQVKQRNAKVMEQINILKAKIAEDEPKCVQLREDNNALRSQMIGIKELQKSNARDADDLKSEKIALVASKEVLNGELASLSEATSRTRSRIVQSPERIKRTITTMSHNASDDKQRVALNEAKARELQAKINALSNIDKDVRSCVEQLQTVEKEVRLLQESQKESHELKDLLEDKQIERKELSSRQDRVQKQMSNAQDKLERAQRHAEDRKIASQKTLDRLQREYDEMAVERRDNDKQVEELRVEGDALESKMASHLKEQEAELNQLLSEYWKLRHDTGAHIFRTRLSTNKDTDLYMETLANKLNMRVDFT